MVKHQWFPAKKNSIQFWLVVNNPRWKKSRLSYGSSFQFKKWETTKSYDWKLIQCPPPPHMDILFASPLQGASLRFTREKQLPGSAWPLVRIRNPGQQKSLTLLMHGWRSWKVCRKPWCLPFLPTVDKPVLSTIEHIVEKLDISLLICSSTIEHIFQQSHFKKCSDAIFGAEKATKYETRQTLYFFH